MIDEFICEHINCAVVDDIYWYIAQESNLLIGIDLNTMKMREISCIPYKKSERAQYRSLLHADNRLYILPFFSNIMYVYDYEKKDYRGITISNKDVMATGAICRDDWLYIYSNTSPDIIKYNFEDGSVERISVSIDIDLPSEGAKHYFWTDAFLHNRVIYIPFVYNNALLRLDDKDNTSVITLGNSINYWESVRLSYTDDCLYSLFSNNENLYCSSFDFDGNEISSFQLNIKLENYVIFSQNKWILLPYFDCKSCVIDADTGNILNTNELNQLLCEEDAFYTYGERQKSDFRWVSLSKHNLKSLLIDSLGNIKVDTINLNDDNRRMLKESCIDIIRKRSLISENKLMTLESFITAIA